MLTSVHVQLAIVSSSPLVNKILIIKNHISHSVKNDREVPAQLAVDSSEEGNFFINSVFIKRI